MKTRGQKTSGMSNKAELRARLLKQRREAFEARNPLAAAFQQAQRSATVARKGKGWPKHGATPGRPREKWYADQYWYAMRMPARQPHDNELDQHGNPNNFFARFVPTLPALRCLDRENSS